MIIWLNMELRVINAQKGNAMRITVSFDGERNEELIARLKNTNGDRILLDNLCEEYDEMAVLNALFHATKDSDWPEEFSSFTWEEEIEDWFYQYFFEDCMMYVEDRVFGEEF